MDTAYKVNDIKCDIQCVHMEVELVMPSSVIHRICIPYIPCNSHIISSWT